MRLIKWTMIVLFLGSLLGCQSMEPADFDKERAAQARLKLGLAYLAQGDKPEAYQNLALAMQYDPNNRDVQLGMAIYEQQIGEYDIAEQRILALLDSGKDQEILLIHYGAFLCSTDRYAQAMEQFNKSLALKQYQWREEGLERAGLCAIENGDKATAKPYFTQLISYNPAKKQQLTEIAEQYRQMGQPQVAQDLLSVL
ncbi:tetratricopeptide repeat protein [Zophobihabitans entericus]|uniref:Tetratricopeptide repeat protein n=1 Tax=Zophobihabitans entericus TaxID=1635327 RepID=A0A6G9I8I9_9GAMM|nr:tetratricopeptide repeat protein [Zophobihabitans entericus]QIQ20531.1 tetratricopeptide repeat protein [Zophobihabitans entericus]